jgi:hypothetical protein
MMLTGDSISGVETAQKTLQSGNYPGAELEARVLGIAERISDSSRVTADQQAVRASRHGIMGSRPIRAQDAGPRVYN